MKNGTYKTYARTARTLTVEESFNKGMQYIGTPLEEGYCRALVNYDFKDGGAALIPRGGLRVLPNTPRVIATKATRLRLSHTENTIDLLDDSLHRYALCVPDNNEAEVPLSDTVVLAQDGLIDNVPNMVVGSFADTADKAIIRQPIAMDTRLHTIPLDRMYPRDVHTVLNDVTYLPVRIDNACALGRLTLQRTATSAPYTFKLDAVTPKEIYPSEAANYGYNMLKPAPYSFLDVQSTYLTAGLINILGVLPYEDTTCNTVALHARVGSAVTFRAVCEWANTTDVFKFKWELHDLESDASVVYETPTDTSKSYTFNGTNAVSSTGTAHVTLTLQPPYKQFGLVVTAYLAADLTKPIASVILASYALTADAQNDTGLQLKTYDLTTAQGMCTWRQHLVLWGVEKAQNILFVSAINEPAYFPYPNNCNVTSGKILACVPFMDNLLIFTESQALLATWQEEGTYYTCKVIQDNLRLTAMDALTIRTVANMVYFKSGNYYYMIVPTMSTATLTSSLTLAPISSSITNLLDNFYPALYELVEEIYNPMQTQALGENESYAIKLSSFTNYLDGSCVRNVYKCRLVIQNSVTYELLEIGTFDFVLNYDTLIRTWSCYMYEANDTELMPFIRNVADKTVFLNLTNAPTMIVQEGETDTPGYTQTLELVQQDVHQIKDAFTLDRGELETGRRFKNWQLIDTGYREHDSTVKKRYRELQFGVNNISRKALVFGVAFVLDSALRQELYKYAVERASDDPADPMFGQVLYAKVFDNPMLIPGATVLGPGEELFPPVTLRTGETLHSNCWTLDVSELSFSTLRRARIPASGKGYAPRIVLLSFNSEQYELLNVAWVSRTMNGR